MKTRPNQHYRPRALGMALRHVPVAVCLLLGSCESADKGATGSSRWESQPARPRNAAGDLINPSTGEGIPGDSFALHPFDPATMRIHPLTHFQRPDDIVPNAGGTSDKPATNPRVNCFIEFKDRWGDPCKALGVLQVQLYRPSTDPGQERQDAKWDADLTDLQRNADWFDPVTRAYRLQLELPPWLGDPASDGQIKLRIVFTPSSPLGESHRLRDEFVVSKQ